jgi:EmrB/QacA subfamily drug resistance transporter
MVLAAMCACTALVVGFVASINLAVPMLAAGSLHPTSSQLLWIVDAYVVFFACLVIPGGAAGDRYGRKGVLLAGLLVFAAGAAVSATATGVPVMLIGRAVTGVGAACVLPNTLAILIHATPPSKRGGAIAVWAAMSGVGGVIGNVGGGALLSTGSWRWLFAAVVPIALGCLAWVAQCAPKTARHDRHLDPVAALLLTLATVALLVGVIQGPEDGWSSVTVIAGFAVSVALFAAWVLTELRAEHPLLDPRLFRIPALRAACLGMLVSFFGLFALFYVNASFLQYGKGFSVLQTGLGIIPVTVPLLLGARFVPALSARVGAPVTLAAAFAAIGGGLLGLSTSTATTAYAAYAAWLVLVGIGLTLALPRLTADISGSLPQAQAGVGAGLQATTREFGSALGVAVIGTVLTSRFIGALPKQLQHGGHTPRTVAEALSQVGSTALRHDVLQAFVLSAGTALRVIGIVTLIAGAVVTAQSAQTALSGRLATRAETRRA